MENVTMAAEPKVTVALQLSVQEYERVERARAISGENRSAFIRRAVEDLAVAILERR